MDRRAGPGARLIERHCPIPSGPPAVLSTVSMVDALFDRNVWMIDERNRQRARLCLHLCASIEGLLHRSMRSYVCDEVDSWSARPTPGDRFPPPTRLPVQSLPLYSFFEGSTVNCAPTALQLHLTQHAVQRSAQRSVTVLPEPPARTRRDHHHLRMALLSCADTPPPPLPLTLSRQERGVGSPLGFFKRELAVSI